MIRVEDAPLWHGLTTGLGLALVIVSALAGVVTLILVWRPSFGLARAAAGVGPLVFADPAWAHGVGALCLLALRRNRRRAGRGAARAKLTRLLSDRDMSVPVVRGTQT